MGDDKADASKKVTKTVPLVMYHNDQRIVVGEATVELDTLTGKGKITQPAGRDLSEVTGTVFTFGSLV